MKDKIARGLGAYANTAAGISAAGGALEATLRRTQLRLIAGHVGALGGVAGTNVSNGTDVLATYRQRIVFPPGSFSNLQFIFPNWRLTNSGETAGANDITIKAWFEYGGVSYQLFFNGATSAVIAANGQAVTDPIAIDIVTQPQAWIRVEVSVTSGGVWPLGRQSAGNLSEGVNIGNATGSSTGSSGFTAGVMYGPTAVVGIAGQSTVAVLAITDSRGAGAGEYTTSGDGVGNVGYIERALGGVVAWAGIQRSNTTVADFNSTHWRSMARAPQFASSAITQRGINDVRAPVSLATLQGYVIQEWTTLAARYSLFVFQTTLDPNTTSTDGWTTVAGQTVTDSSQNAVRVAFNDWIRAGAPMQNGAAVAIGTSGALLAGQSGHPLTGYFEIADLLESGRNSGLWAVSPTARNLASTAITSGTNILTCSTGAFTSADVGTSVYVPGAGAAGAALIAQVSGVTNSTTATLSANAGTTVSAASAKVGGYTADGLHASSAGHAAAKVGIDTSRLR